MPASTSLDPEYCASTSELHCLLQEAILALPEDYRTVLVLRDVEEMSTAEAASALEITEQSAKVRLHRARALLRKELYARTRGTTTAVFQFPATRCDRVVANVFARLPQL
jgi:RNA polymerase sigma-70 factor (ECF subfamily)